MGISASAAIWRSRAALNPDVLAAACSSTPSDIDTGTLGKGDDSLKRADDIKGELLTVWGRQDPHVPLDGRNLIRARLEEVGANFQWHEGQRPARPSCVTRGRANDPGPGISLLRAWCSELFHPPARIGRPSPTEALYHARRAPMRQVGTRAVVKDQR